MAVKVLALLFFPLFYGVYLPLYLARQPESMFANSYLKKSNYVVNFFIGIAAGALTDVVLVLFVVIGNTWLDWLFEKI